jgi:peptidoglycan hydrolase-like protein with peptidoglycan-binding domain
MRFREFNLTEAVSLAVPTSRSGPEVSAIQQVLLALGYDVGPNGVDGIRGPDTVAAVKQFQQAAGIAMDGDPGTDTVAALNATLAANPAIASKIAQMPVAAAQPSTTQSKIPLSKASGAGSEEARTSAEKFLGRKMSDQEWDYLLRATVAEASGNTSEQAHVMGVILNRVRSGKWGSTVESVLTARNQFQAVTGTRQNPGPSANFTNGPSGTRLTSILSAAVDILPEVPTNIMNFTAAKTAAYGPGTNIGFRDKMIAQGGTRIGDTIFA